jgi:hypothetical protein
MWLQRGDVPVEYRSVRHLGATLLDVVKSARLQYKDDDGLKLSECIGFSHKETFMLKLEDGLKKTTGVVIGLITPRSASMSMKDIAQNRVSKEVLRLQAHHYVVLPEVGSSKLDKNQGLAYHVKLWGVACHQPGILMADSWGEVLSQAIQTIMRMDHPTDISVQLEAEELLDVVMLKAKGAWPGAVPQ